MVASRLALGTVQLGMPYGLANIAGQVEPPEAAAIVNHARAAGIDTLDTAIAYGDSERRLGEIGVRGWKVISKLPPLPASCDVSEWVRESTRGSLERLGVQRLYGLLLHRSQDLLDARSRALYAALLALQAQGLVDKIGVSIYGPQELDVLHGRFKLDLVQAPFNILDRRLASSGWLGNLREQHVEVHIRSVFLQGLLLMPADRRPARFAKWRPLWNDWDAWLQDRQVSPVQACLSFALAQREVDRVVVGVENVAQLRDILAVDTSTVHVPPERLASEDPNLINPSRWNAH